MTSAARCGDNNNCAKTEKSLVFFQNVFYNIFIYCLNFFSPQDVLNRRLEERTDEMVERGLVDELCQFKNQLVKKTSTNE